MREELDKRTKQVEILLELNRSLELDLATVTVQTDYEEARIAIPKYCNPSARCKQEFRLLNIDSECSLPHPDI